MRNISVKLFRIWIICPDDIFYLELWWPFCLAEWNPMGKFGRAHHGEHFCENICIWTSGSVDV